jgi:hypothetical protein
MAWCNKWGMKFNQLKCCVMTFSKNTDQYLYNYKMNDHVLERVNSVVDLGVTVTDNLKWDNHINNLVSRANQRLGLVKRCLGVNCSSQIKLLCYKSLIRPLLESCSCAWSCNSKKLVVKIESVQRRATKFILDDYNTEYNIRLSMCNLLPLSLRRDYLDFVFFYNFIHHLVYVKLSINMIDPSTYIRTRSNLDELNICASNHKTFLYSKMYNCRISRSWNLIPYNIRSIELSEGCYNSPVKRYLKQWLFKIFTEKFDTYNTCSWHVFCGCNTCTLT